jgi:hypothetical protein
MENSNYLDFNDYVGNIQNVEFWLSCLVETKDSLRYYKTPHLHVIPERNFTLFYGQHLLYPTTVMDNDVADALVSCMMFLYITQFSLLSHNRRLVCMKYVGIQTL